MLEKYSARGRRGIRRAASARILLAVASAALLATALLLSSCARKPTQGAVPTPAAAENAEQKQENPLRPEPSRAGKTPGEKPAPALAAALRGFGLGVPSTPRMPEDFSLGALQSYSPAKGDEAAVLAVARAFMDGIKAGKLDEKLLLPEAREALSVLLAPPEPQNAPGSAAPRYRLGAIAIQGDDASLKLRMPRAEGESVRVEGLLSLRKSGEAWYVQALALKPPETAALAFSADERETASAGRAAK